MRVMTSLGTLPLRGAGDRAAAAEAAGFDGVTTQENRHDPFLPLGAAALTTERVSLATNVLIAFPRSPMVVANAAWDLQAMSGGRFVVGLGSQVRGHIVRRFSSEWRAPAQKMREYVQSLRAIFDCWANGEPLSYEGEHYQFSLMTPNFTPEPLEMAPPPIRIAAVGPLMMRVAAEECDGVMLHGFATRAYLENQVLPNIRATLDQRGVDAADFEISGGGFVATGATQADVDRMYEWIRQRVGFYGSTPSYWPVFEEHGLEDLGRRLNTMSKAGEWDEMTALIEDDVVDLFCAKGTHDTIAGAIEERFGGLVDTVSLDASTPASVVEEVSSVGG